MKKFLHWVPLVALFLLLVLFLPQQASAYTSGYYTYTVSNGEATITGVDTAISGDVTIPSTLGGYPVTCIGDDAFEHCDSLTSVIVPDSVTSIGHGAFFECYSLTSVTIGDGVKSIGNAAFAFCDSLTSITIPDSVTSIGGGFFECASLTGIWVKENNTMYSSDKYGVLYNKDKTTLIEAPGGIQGSYTIPYSVTNISGSAFQGRHSLSSVTIPDSVTTIGTCAFFDCTSLTDVYYEGTNAQWGAISIGEENGDLINATLHISPLTFTLNSDGQSYSVTDCSTSASGELVIPSTHNGRPVTSIEESAFYDCDNLVSITIPCGVTSIGKMAFENCNNLISVTIPNSVISIETGAFAYCYNLESITIPASTTHIGSSVFHCCYELSGIWVDTENAYYSSDSQGVLFDKRKENLLEAPGDLRGKYTVPDGVVKIHSGAFYSCGITGIEIPASITSIGGAAFEWCSLLKSVYITDLAAWCRINFFDTPFRYANKLYLDGSLVTELIIPEGVAEISSNAFYNCSNLTSVTIPDGVTSIGKSAFYGCTGIKNVCVADPSAWCKINFGDTYSNPMYYGGQLVILNLDINSTTEIVLAQGVSRIPDGVFRGYSNLISITIPESVTSIGNYAFYGCAKLSHIVYGGTRTQWEQISIGSDNSYLLDAPVRHYKATEDSVHYLKNCINAGLFCDLCDDFLTREKAESGEHTYEDDVDTYCDDCGYIRTVKEISIAQRPTNRYYSLLIDDLDVTGGILNVVYSDGSIENIAITLDMVSGFDKRVCGRQSIKVTYCGKRAYYTIMNQADYTPDKLEILTGPTQISYLVNDTALWDGLTLKATYEDVEVEIPLSDVKVDKVDMTTAGIKTVTVRFYDAVATFPIYVHKMQQQTIDSGLYPESKHNYAANSDDTKIFTYPGAGSLTLTFSAQSYMETNCDYIYILDRMGNQIGQYTGSLANVVVTVPGDTVQIRLVSDDSVNKYGYAFSSITTEAITHPGADFCEICGELKIAAGKIVLPENMSAVNMTIPAGATIDLNGHILTVDSLASFGQIIDSVGGGGLIVENIEITGNEWLPIQDSTGCYRFHEYEVENLGAKTGTGSAIFGFTLDFEDATAYTTLLETDDVQITVTLAVGDNTQTYAFSRELIAKYVDLVAKYPTLQPYLRLNVTGLDSVADGTVIAVTPALTAVDGKISALGTPITYTA